MSLERNQWKERQSNFKLMSVRGIEYNFREGWELRWVLKQWWKLDRSCQRYQLERNEFFPLQHCAQVFTSSYLASEELKSHNYSYTDAIYIMLQAAIIVAFRVARNPSFQNTQENPIYQHLYNLMPSKIRQPLSLIKFKTSMNTHA